VRAQPHDLRARHLAANVGDAEAAFPVLDPLFTDRRDHRIDERHHLEIVAFAVDAGDEEAHALVDLRRGEADAFVLGHRLDHVVDQFLEDRGTDLGRIQFAGTRAQHGMAHACDFENRHRLLLQLRLPVKRS